MFSFFSQYLFNLDFSDDGQGSDASLHFFCKILVCGSNVLAVFAGVEREFGVDVRWISDISRLLAC